MNLEKWINWISNINQKAPFDFFKIILIVGTYFLGEVGFFPFGSTFRLGLGSVFYILCLYSFPQLVSFLNAFLTGIMVVMFRVMAEYLTYKIPLETLFQTNVPAILYYVALTFGLMLPWFKRNKENPVHISLYFVSFDFVANVLELSFSINTKLSFHGLYILALGAGVKGLFFLAFIATMEFFKQRIMREKEKEKFQGQLLLGANLYAEGYFLKKIMQDIEDVTEQSFQIYQQSGNYLKEKGYQRSLLNLAEKIHEIKKDTQRVFSSLDALIEPNDYTRIDLSELMNIVINSQQRYAQVHHKEIEWFFSSYSQICYVDNFFPILVIVNNILANGIDAIDEHGCIGVIWNLEGQILHLHLGNTGKPIPFEDLDYIFLPGFTTKYSDAGSASTGIGLTHVQHVLNEVGGTVEIKQAYGKYLWTWFHINLPLNKS